ncbi:inositol monophosphatase family protein [Streptomyces sp. NPDC020965]|uniref:inositol monophosphatase family protein n=1 Tax=Streptomyces sp. NPDC020965 TaxID=3365105 RepID=UPI0037B8E8D8
MTLAHAEAASEAGSAELLELAIRAARMAGDLLLRGLTEGPLSVQTKSAPTDLVTDLDRRSEALIVELLTDRRPDDGVLGEEGGERPGTSGVRWVIDPLDGTGNYVSGNPGFVVSIAAEVDGAATVGVVHDPSRQETFSAVRGRGARRDGRTLAPDRAATLQQALVSTGFSSDLDLRSRQADLATRVVGRVRDLRNSGSAALDLCWVAAGRLDAYYEAGLYRWDHAAGALIAAEAGAWVGGLDDGPADIGTAAGRDDGGTIVACPPALAAELRELLTEGGA